MILIIWRSPTACPTPGLPLDEDLVSLIDDTPGSCHFHAISMAFGSWASWSHRPPDISHVLWSMRVKLVSTEPHLALRVHKFVDSHLMSLVHTCPRTRINLKILQSSCLFHPHRSTSCDHNIGKLCYAPPASLVTCNLPQSTGSNSRDRRCPTSCQELLRSGGNSPGYGSSEQLSIFNQDWSKKFSIKLMFHYL